MKRHLDRQAREEFERKKAQLAEEFLRQQRRYKIGLIRFLLRARLLVALTPRIIYAGWIPFLLLDRFVTVYRAMRNYFPGTNKVNGYI